MLIYDAFSTNMCSQLTTQPTCGFVTAILYGREGTVRGREGMPRRAAARPEESGEAKPGTTWSRRAPTWRHRHRWTGVKNEPEEENFSFFLLAPHKGTCSGTASHTPWVMVTNATATPSDSRGCLSDGRHTASSSGLCAMSVTRLRPWSWSQLVALILCT